MAFSAKNLKIEVSTNNTTWTNITGQANAISVDGGERMTEDLFYFGQDTGEIVTGPREPLEVTVKVVYLESATGAFETVRQAYEAGSSLYVRWSPQGGAAGNFQFATDAGVVTSFGYPTGEAGSADPLMCEFTLRTPKITKSVIA